jgi:diacylglycerol kinase family enzyme
VPGGAEANKAILRDHLNLLGPSTLLCIGAGDGTVHLVINFLLTDPAVGQQARLTPILPLWGGNANDLAVMLNGPYVPGTFDHLREQGEVINIKPLRFDLQFADGTQRTVLASNYASFGATALAAHRLNQHEHRKASKRRNILARWLLELITTGRALMQSSRFQVEENGRKRRVYEKIFASGPRFAKLNLMPARLTDSAFYAHTFEHKRLFAILGRFTKSLHRNPDDFLLKRAAFTVLSPVTAQFDGETTQLPPNTKVTLEPSPVPFRALTQRD